MNDEHDRMKDNPFNSVDDKDLHFLWEAVRSMAREQEFIIDKFQEIVGGLQLIKIQQLQLKETLNKFLDSCENSEN